MVIAKDLRTRVKAIGVLSKILQVGELFIARQNPRAYTPAPSPLQNGCGYWELLQSGVECRVISTELHGQTGSPKLEFLRLHVVNDMPEAVFLWRPSEKHRFLARGSGEYAFAG